MRPTLTLVASKTEVRPGETFTLTATSSIPLGDQTVTLHDQDGIELATLGSTDGVTYKLDMEIGSARTIPYRYYVMSSGNAAFFSSSSNNVDITVAKVRPTLTLVASKTEVRPGETFTLTATSSIPLGDQTVTLHDQDGIELATLGSTDGVTYKLDMEIGSARTIPYRYFVMSSGNDAFLSSSSNNVDITVAKVRPTLTLVASKTEVRPGETFTLTATSSIPLGDQTVTLHDQDGIELATLASTDGVTYKLDTEIGSAGPFP